MKAYHDEAEKSVKEIQVKPICSGYDKALLIDFNYKVEPLPGMFPFPGLGPFSLLAESYFNYYGKMMFKWVYWNLMLAGNELPLENQMNMAGKMRQGR